MRLDVDKIGTVASSLCAIHCLLSGIALGVLSVLGVGFIGNPLVDVGFIGLALVVGLAAARTGFRHHSSLKPTYLMAAGFASIALSHYLVPHHEGKLNFVTIIGTILAVAGGLLLVSFHLLNRRLHRLALCTCYDESGAVLPKAEPGKVRAEKAAV